MGNFDKNRGSVAVGRSSWTSGLERRIMMKINSFQQHLEYWRSYFLTRDFWSFTWLWTLLQLKISSLRIRFAVGQGAKKKLMSWVAYRIPKPYLENGFPACFQDGVVLCALVEKLSIGACPRFDVLDPEQKLRNLKLALYLVGKHLHIKPGVSAEHILRGGKLAERQLLLLLAHMKMASEKLELFQNHKKSAFPPTNQKTHCPFDSHRNCSARGMGLMLAVQGRKACFSVLICSTENLDMVIEIRGPKNTACSKRITSMRSLSRGNSIDLCDVDVRNEILKKRIPLDYKILGNKLSVNYTPLENGAHKMSIIWQGQHIPGSPYTINVDNSMDVPDQDIWCPRTERSLKRSGSHSISESNEQPTDRPQPCENNRRGRVIRKRILRYIVKVGGNDVVVDDPDQLSEAINSLRRISEDKGIVSTQDAENSDTQTSTPDSNAPATEQLEACLNSGIVSSREAEKSISVNQTSTNSNVLAKEKLQTCLDTKIASSREAANVVSGNQISTSNSAVLTVEQLQTCLNTRMESKQETSNVVSGSQTSIPDSNVFATEQLKSCLDTRIASSREEANVVSGNQTSTTNSNFLATEPLERYLDARILSCQEAENAVSGNQTSIPDSNVLATEQLETGLDTRIMANQDSENQGSNQASRSESNVLAVEQFQTCNNTRVNVTDTRILDVDKTISKSVLLKMQLGSSPTEHCQASTSIFKDADSRHKQFQNDKCLSDTKSSILGVSREDLTEKDPSNPIIAAKETDFIRSDVGLPILNYNNTPPKQIFSTKKTVKVFCMSNNTPAESSDDTNTEVSLNHLTSVTHEKMPTNKSPIDNFESLKESDNVVYKSKAIEHSSAVRYNIDRNKMAGESTSTLSIDGTRLDEVSSKGLASATHEKTASSQSTIEHYEKPEECNNVVSESKAIDHSSATRFNIKHNKMAADDGEEDTSPREGIFFAKLINGNFDNECDRIDAKERRNEPATNETVLNNETLKSDGNEKVKDTQVNSEPFKGLMKQCNSSENNENDINQKEVLPYIRQIIQTADKLRSGSSFQIKDADSRFHHTNFVAGRNEKKISTNAKCSEFQSKVRNNEDKNYNKKGFEWKSKECQDFFNDSESLKFIAEGSINSNLTNHLKDKNYLYRENQSEKSANLSDSLKNSKEKLDNKLNIAREMYLKSIIGNSINNTSSFGKEETEYKIRNADKKLRKDEISVTDFEDVSWKVGQMSSEIEGVFPSSDKNIFQGNKAKLNESKLLNCNPDGAVCSNVNLFECEHSFPSYEITESDNLYSNINSSESLQHQKQNSRDNDFMSNFLQNFEELKTQINKDKACLGNSRLSNYLEELSKNYSSICDLPDNNAEIDDYSKNFSDFDEMVFEVHQNDASNFERNIQRKRTSWSEKSALSCIRESSIEGILDDDELDDAYHYGLYRKSFDTEMTTKDGLSQNPVQATNSETISFDSTVYEAHIMAVNESIKNGNSERSHIYEANISPVRVGQHNASKTSISLLCASPYGFKSDSTTHDNIKTIRDKYSTLSHDSNTVLNQVEHVDITGHMAESTGYSSTLQSQEVTRSYMEQKNQAEADDVINSFDTDQKLSPIPSVRKVIEIFQKEQEEPIDKWPVPETSKKSSSKIIFGNDLECSKPTSTEPNYISLTTYCDKEENQNRTSIKDRVRMFETESPKLNHSSKMKHGVTRPPTAATILDKKRYWENFSH